MIKLSKIKSIKQCPFKGYLSQFEYRTEQNKYLHLLDLYKRAIKEEVSDYESFFNDNINDSFYILDRTLQIDRNIFVTNLNRYKSYSSSFTIIDTSIHESVTISGVEISTNIDLVIEQDGNIGMIKLSQSKPKLSYNARSEDNKPENNLELCTMRLAGQKLYPDKHVFSAIFHIQGKYDEKENYELFLNGERNTLIQLYDEEIASFTMFMAEGKKREANKCNTIAKKIKGILEFNGDDGCHIIKCDEFDEGYIISELNELMSIDLSLNSNKCKTAKCAECKNYVLCKSSDYNKVELEKVEEVIKEKTKTTPTRAQMSYINTTKGYHRINAVNGAGKSFTTALRTAKLLETNDIDDVLLITFTNAGAEELRNKIDNLTTMDKNKLNIFTFNSFGMSIIEKEYTRLGFTDKPQLLPKLDKIDVLESLLNKYPDLEWLNYKYPLLNMPNAKGALYELFEIIDNVKSFGMSEEYKEFDGLDTILEEYSDYLINNNLLDYEDQLILLIKLFEDNPELLDIYGYKHIMVDEFQDTNARQISLLQLMSKDRVDSLCAVGHDSQSIYSFRRTSPEFMINFGEYFPNFEDIFLLDNFRSTPEICDVANKLIELNEDRVDMYIKSNKPSGANVELIGYNTVADEYEEIAKSIQEQIENGTEINEIAVIARQSKELLGIQEELSKFNIPSKLFTPQLHMNNHNIRLIINLAKYLTGGRNNEHYLFEYIMATKPVKSKADLSTFMNEFKEVIGDEDFNNFDLFLDITKEIREEDSVCDKFIMNSLSIKPWSYFGEFSKYLQKHVTYNDDSQSEKETDKLKAVNLTSYHSSKGMEWDCVYTVLDKLKYNEKDEEELSEERRVLFVGITRPKDTLIITYSRNEDKKRDKGKYTKFVDELELILK